MKPNIIYLVLALMQFIGIYDIHRHNKMVEDFFPDPDDQKQVHYQIKLKIPLYGYGFMFVVLIGLFISSFFGD